MLAHGCLDRAEPKPPGAVRRRRNGEKYKGRALFLRRCVQDIGDYPFCPFADKPPDIGNRILRLGLLKQRDAGRATFLPISTIRGSLLREQGLEDCAGFVGIAGTLCGCKPEYEGILHSLLGRIAIAEDLDSAVAIAKRYSYRFRVVTLDGQVVNAGGSLTGGSLARNSGLISRKAEIERFRAEAAELAAQAPAYARAGARIFGGCCGAGPDHLAAVKMAVEGIDFSAFPPVEHDPDVIPCASEKEARFITPDVDVGETIECTPDLLEDILMAEEVSPQGALKIAILEEDDLDIFAENQYAVKDALCLFSDVPELLEKALRIYQGRAFWDGTGDLEEDFLRNMADKYGLILL